MEGIRASVTDHKQSSLLRCEEVTSLLKGHWSDRDVHYDSPTLSWKPLPPHRNLMQPGSETVYGAPCSFAACLQSYRGFNGVWNDFSSTWKAYTRYHRKLLRV
ncbi:uncharacterized protein LOC114879132 isoform X2 [Osmia bicornis bicornis]|uniref:uncharacterized protein LOC114879132 isoform X2 n=1 Tax=Osmia bicornis bicornis TaxID=1437191 RepID=UPI0010F76230|nr:uncharacterized protein LOC114879132 isoform X2 [Osmia bicornis bicornis]